MPLTEAKASVTGVRASLICFHLAGWASPHRMSLLTLPCAAPASPGHRLPTKLTSEQTGGGPELGALRRQVLWSRLSPLKALTRVLVCPHRAWLGALEGGPGAATGQLQQQRRLGLGPGQ